MNTLTYAIRFIVLMLLGVLGAAMAVVFMVSTAIAIGVLYVVARIKGRPFGVRAYWAQRQAQRNGTRTYTGSSYNDPNVIDVKARELH